MADLAGTLSRFSVAIALFGALSAGHAATPKQSELLGAATRLGAQYDANYALHDPVAMASLYATDGVLVSPAGNIIHGHDALVSYYRTRFSNGAVKHHIDVLEVHSQGNGGYGIAHISIESKDSNGELHTETGNLVAVFVKNEDGWHFHLIEPSIPLKSGS